MVSDSNNKFHYGISLMRKLHVRNSTGRLTWSLFINNIDDRYYVSVMSVMCIKSESNTFLMVYQMIRFL